VASPSKFVCREPIGCTCTYRKSLRGCDLDSLITGFSACSKNIDTLIPSLTHRRRATEIPAATNEMFIWQSPTHSVYVCVARTNAITTCLLDFIGDSACCMLATTTTPRTSNKVPHFTMNTTTKPIDLAVVGAHLSGFPLNRDLTNLGATLQKRTKTSPQYKLYELQNTTPAKPGLVRDQRGGRSIEIEIWRIPISNVGSFLETISTPLGLGSIEIEDGSWVKGFICEPYGLEGAKDVTAFGGWRNYRESCT
jgi:hypothetical protein